MVSDGKREEIRQRLRYDTPLWARHCATILSEDKRPIKVEPRPWQARTPDTPAHIVPLDEALEKQRLAGQPMRAIILKARKLGFSTWVQLKFMQRITQMPFQYALVCAHTRPTASVLYDMGRLIYARLPSEDELGLGINIRPQIVGNGTTRDGSRWMALGDKARPTEASIYETMTAGGSSGIGRGYTPSMFHGSEAGHYKDPEGLTGLLNSIPKIEETIVVLESTANGFNHFYDRWVRAVEGAEDEFGGLYTPLFYGWQDNPYNCLRFPNVDARARFIETIGDEDGGGDDEEILLYENGVTPEQLWWRRITISEECGGSLEFFHQEHPSTPEEAFIGSGDPVFPGILVSKAIRRAQACHEPVFGVLRGADHVERKTRGGTIRVPQRAIWVPFSDIEPEDRELWGTTPLRVWEHPVNEETQEGVPEKERRPDGQYVQFVDVAQGKLTTTEDRDYSAIQVVDHVSRMQVLSYRSRVPLHELPEVALLVALYYNEAWLAPEATGLGIGVVDALRGTYRYKRLYRRKRRGDDQRDDQDAHYVGWQTTLQSKPLMEITFGSLLKTADDGLRCVLTAREASTYVSDEKGRHGAQKGAFDDLLMAYMGAQQVASELRPRDPNEKRKKSVRGFTVPEV